ncbi:MAG TPA: glutathione peroxidase [Alteraurantiacibacter sp.]
MSDIFSIGINTLQGQPGGLGDYSGKVILVVNVASQCGLTPQYEGLVKLYREYKDRGFVVAGFPSNDFAGQEPGTAEEIGQFCSATYGVDFPMFEKIAVTGEGKHPLYAALTAAMPLGEAGGAFREKLKGFGVEPNTDPEVLWNFEKFLIGRDGQIAARFSPATGPDDPTVLAKIEELLAA